jgi:hypothetical protein
VPRQLLDDAESEDGRAGGVIKNVQPDHARIEFFITHRAWLSKLLCIGFRQRKTIYTRIRLYQSKNTSSDLVYTASFFMTHNEFSVRLVVHSWVHNGAGLKPM